MAGAQVYQYQNVDTHRVGEALQTIATTMDAEGFDPHTAYTAALALVYSMIIGPRRELMTMERIQAFVQTMSEIAVTVAEAAIPGARRQ